jgi:hypothetical protein
MSMHTFMVVATFKPETDMRDVFAVVNDELAQVEVLRAEARMGSIHISLARGTTFIEVFAPDEGSARATAEALPMARWWDLDVYPTAPPALPSA